MMERVLCEARRALDDGDPGAARRALVSVLREDPTHVGAWVLLSRAVGTTQSAVWCLSRAVKIDPQHPELLRALDVLRTGDEPPGAPDRHSGESQTSSRPDAVVAFSHSVQGKPLASSPPAPLPGAEGCEGLTDAPSDEEGLVEEAPALGREGGRRAPDSPSARSRVEETQAQLKALKRRRGAQERQLEELISRSEDLAAEIVDKETEAENLTRSVEQLREELARLMEEREDVERGVDGQLTHVVEEAVQSGPSRLASASGGAGVGSSMRPRASVIILVGLGILLLLLGTFLAYPHIASRLWWLPGVLGAPGGAPPRIAAQEMVILPTASSTPSSKAEDGMPLRAMPRVSARVDSAHQPSATPNRNARATSEPALEEPLRTTLPISPEPEPTATVTPSPAIPTRIVIPNLGLDAPVVPVGWSMALVEGHEMGVWDVPDERAAGWHDESAPLGQMGNIVLNGHNTTYGEVFRDLYRLRLDDVIIVYAGERPYHYRVAASTIFREWGQPMDVRAEHAALLGPTDDQRLTLVTCHPYGSTVNRLVITGVPVTARPAAERYGE